MERRLVMKTSGDDLVLGCRGYVRQHTSVASELRVLLNRVVRASNRLKALGTD